MFPDICQGTMSTPLYAQQESTRAKLNLITVRHPFRCFAYHLFYSVMTRSLASAWVLFYVPSFSPGDVFDLYHRETQAINCGGHRDGSYALISLAVVWERLLGQPACNTIPPSSRRASTRAHRCCMFFLWAQLLHTGVPRSLFFNLSNYSV